MSSIENVTAKLADRGYPHPIDINHLIWHFYAAAETGTLPIYRVEAAIDDGSIFDLLQAQFDIAPPPVDTARCLDYLQRAYDTDTYGIASNGLLLLHAHLVEALQQAFAICTETH